MTKKVLALVLVLALALGALAVTATADKADEIDYRVGYAKTDINPYWSVWEAAGNSIPTQAVDSTSSHNKVTSDHIMPLPMGGYGGNVHRLSRPELIDDTGTGNTVDSGVVYLSNNRYTEAFAKEMLGEGTEAYKAYAAKGFGQNDGDGIYVTCVSVQQNENAEPVLIFSVDLISVAETFAGQAKNVIIRELKKLGIDIAPNRIIINATHTHGAVALGESFSASATYKQKLYGFDNKTSFDEQTDLYVPFSGSELSSYLNFYRKFLYDQMAAAAVKALTEGQSNGTVLMEKGTIDVSDATGYMLNGVRHKKAQLTTTVDGVSQTVDYVTGSSFNVSLTGGKEIEAVSKSNDLLHVVQFSFPESSGVKPILMVNWRAHTTANNKMNTKAHNNLSADFVAAMRYQLEQWGYRPILNYGASGNLGMGDTPTTYNISTSATTTTMNATKYGYDLAYAAAFLANSSQSEVQTYRTNKLTEIKNKRGSFSLSATSTYQIWNKVYSSLQSFTSPGLTVCDQGEILLESTYYSVAYQTGTSAQAQAALYHNALAVDEGGSASNDGGLKLEKTGYPFVVKAGTYTANGQTFEITEDVVIASQYHANAMKNRGGAINNKRISLTAFMLGEQLAFATVPFEASDRYSMSATLETASDYNDWDNLINNDKWGTPIVMSLVNGSEGYVPNNLAYTYSKDLEAKTIAGTIGQNFVAGSYEAHTAYSAAGEGEKIVAELNTLLRGLEDGTSKPVTKTGYCEFCKETVTWTALNDKVIEDNGSNLATGHYYLAEDFTTVFGQVLVYLNETVCVDLNGHTYYACTNTGDSRAFSVYGTLNVMDSVGTGVMKGRAGGGGNGGTIIVGAPGTLNLYSGTLTCDTSGTGTVSMGGVVYVGDNAYFNMYGGTVRDGNVTSYGGNVSAQHGGEVGGTFTMYGGTITGGKIKGADASYGNLMVSANSIFRYVGGYISTGAFMQGTMYLGCPEGYPADTSKTATISVRNEHGTVTLDGIFNAKVKLDYANTKNPDYVAKPTSGDTIGAVTPGSWIDYVGGAKITAQVNTGYVGVVDGNVLKLGTAPATGYCSVCQKSVVWMPMVAGAVNGHFALTGNMTDMAEQTIPAYGKLCLDLKGKTYTAAERAFTVNGILNINDTVGTGVLKGTAVAGENGGTVYVSETGTVNQYNGKVTCDNTNGKPAEGGVVYVAANGNYVLNNGTITGGQATGNGGNLQVFGNFTMNGGTVTNGSAVYGGNVQVQNSAAFFTMNGGTISGGSASGLAATANVCASTGSNFRMSGGAIADVGAYLQGNVTLTGTTNGTVNLSVKVPQERLTIEGTYTGKINLTLVDGNTTYVAGSKIGTSKNANISGATIAVTGHDEKFVAVVGNELQLATVELASIAIKTNPNKLVYALGESLDTTGLVLTANYTNGTAVEITNSALYTVTGFDANKLGEQTLTVTFEGGSATFTVTVVSEIIDYIVGGNTYADLNEALAAASVETPLVLNKNVGTLVLTKDLSLDLNGYNVAALTTGGNKLYILDEATADYDIADGVYGKISNVDDAANVQAAEGYMLENNAGVLSAHKFFMGVTSLVVNVNKMGINYIAEFNGDQFVKSQITEFGVALRAYDAPNYMSVWADTECKTHVAMDPSAWATGISDNSLKGVYIENILDKTVTTAANRQRGEIQIYGRTYVKLADGTMIFGESRNFSMMTAMQLMNERWDALGTANQNSLKDFYAQWSDVMSSWTGIEKMQ